jgi:phosphate transport system substrate-binding protein
MKAIVMAMVAALLFSSAAVQADIRLQGGGATFPNPIYQKWVAEFGKTNPQVKIDYQSQGSGFGIKGITDKTLDFAGSDAPMNEKENATAKASGGPVIHLPMVGGGVVPIYNLGDIGGDLKLDGEVLAAIFLGKITKWNDERIVKLNPELKLPDLGISPVTRSDGSGTTFVFTSYLSTQSEDFSKGVGAGKQVTWPCGISAKGSEGVAAAVGQTRGAITYSEATYATLAKLPSALMENRAGNFVKASPENVSAAGAGAAAGMKNDLAANIWDSDGDSAYPISAFTYVIVYKDLGYLKDEAKAKALVSYLRWSVTDGQKLAAENAYAPLAEPVRKKVLEAIDALTFEGKSLK